MLKIYANILIIISVLFFTGCLKDELLEAENIEIENTAVMLMMLEETGNEITSDPCPILIEAIELYEPKNHYTIIDVRTKEEFAKGHIENAVNVESNNLLAFLKDHYKDSDSKIALVDKDGQSAAYFAALLRLYGYQKTYSLNFGMASWHQDFADCWLNAIESNAWVECKFTDTPFPKRYFTPLPSNIFPASVLGYDNQIKYRIAELLNRGFADTLNKYTNQVSNDYYIVCYGKTSLYISGPRGAFPDQGHGINAVNYSPFNDLLTATNLQTLPSDLPILIYCYNGMLSAATTAYLKVLGYNIKTLLYGGEYLFHLRASGYESLEPYLFSRYRIKNYPYVK